MSMDTIQFNALLAVPDPLLIIQGEYIVFANETMENMLGTSRSVLCCDTVLGRFGMGSDLVAMVNTVRADGQGIADAPITIAVKSGLRAGAEQSVVASVIPIAQNTNPAEQMMVMFKTTPVPIGQGQGAESVSQVINTMAHEVKNPLAGIRGAAQLLDDGHSENPMVSLIIRETDRIVRLMEQLEKLDDVPHGAWQECNIHEILSDVIASARAGFGGHVRITEQYDPSLPPVWCSRDQLVQVFMNLVKNACESVPKKTGSVTIKTQYDHTMRLGDRAVPIAVHVVDNGAGIAPDVMDTLFAPFVSNKSAGSGLGLSVVSKFITNHHGVVNCHNNTPDSGATFTVHLPKYQKELKS